MEEGFYTRIMNENRAVISDARRGKEIHKAKKMLSELNAEVAKHKKTIKSLKEGMALFYSRGMHNDAAKSERLCNQYVDDHNQYIGIIEKLEDAIADGEDVLEREREELYKKKIPELERKAEAGDAAAQDELGSCYQQGNGVEIDNNKAMFWYEKAAEQGNRDSQFYLGADYFSSTNGEFKNLDLAVHYVLKASGQGQKEAVSLARQFGFDYYEHAKKGDTSAQYELGKRLVEMGNLDWIRRAADGGYAKALALLADYYQDGKHGLRVNYEKSFELYQKAAAQGNSGAIANLAHYYSMGKGVGQDLDKALELYEKSQKMGETVSEEFKAAKNMKMYKLAEEGNAAIEKNEHRKAAECLTASLNMGNVDCLISLGVLFTRGGFGLEMDLVKGREYLEKSISFGKDILMAKKILKINKKMVKKSPAAREKILKKYF